MRHTEHGRLTDSSLRSNSSAHRGIPLTGIWLYGPLILFVLLSVVTQAVSSLFQ